MRAEPFGDSRLGPVRKLVLGSEPGPVLELLDLGATVHRLGVTGGDGVRRNVVLGHADRRRVPRLGRLPRRHDRALRQPHRATGASSSTGEVAGGARTTAGTSLHGGPDGFDQRIWEVVDHGPAHAILRLVSPDGDQGFPGERGATAALRGVRRQRARSTLPGDHRCPHRRQPDQPRLLQPRRRRRRHRGSTSCCWSRRGRTLPVDATGIPVGGHDARRRARRSTCGDRTRLGLKVDNGGIDHNFVLSRHGPAARPPSLVVAEHRRPGWTAHRPAGPAGLHGRRVRRLATLHHGARLRPGAASPSSRSCSRTRPTGRSSARRCCGPVRPGGRGSSGGSGRCRDGLAA